MMPGFPKPPFNTASDSASYVKNYNIECYNSNNGNDSKNINDLFNSSCYINAEVLYEGD